MGQIRPLKNTKKGFDRSVDRAVEWHFSFCFQQRSYGGGVLAGGRRQRAAEEIAKIAGIAKIERAKPYHG